MRRPRRSGCVPLAAGILLLFLSAFLFSHTGLAQLIWTRRSLLPLVMVQWPAPTPTPVPKHLVISEVLYAPAGVEPGEEWIEIYNPTDSIVDLSRHKLGDEETPGLSEGMFYFPSKTRIMPGQVLVIAVQGAAFRNRYGLPPDYEFRSTDSKVPDMIPYKVWGAGSVDLSNDGDEVFLLDGDNAVVDAVSWGSATAGLDPSVARVERGHSIERRPAYHDTDSAADWYDQFAPVPWEIELNPPTPTPTATPLPTRPGLTAGPSPTATLTPTPSPTPWPTPAGPVRLLLSEVLYDPSNLVDPDGEWIEILNASGFDLGLAGYGIGDEEKPGGGEGFYRFPPGAGIREGGTVIVAYRADHFLDRYGFRPDFEIVSADPDVPDLESDRDWASGSLNLSNDGDEVLLTDFGGSLLDALSWGNSTWAFDPPAVKVSEGSSLERYPPFFDTDTAADWRAQAAPSPKDLSPSLPTATPTRTPSPTLEPTATDTGQPSPTPTNTPQPAAPGQLLVSEVFYDPIGSDDSAEWMEIYNLTDDILDLDGCKLGDEETPGGGEGMARFPEYASLAPGTVAVVAYKSLAFQSLYGFKPDFELMNSDPTVPDMVAYDTWTSGSVFLINNGDEVLLLDENDNLLDAVSWGDSTWAFDPAVALIGEGYSLERYPPSQDTDSAADWRAQSQPDPGDVDLIPPTPTPTPTDTPSPTPQILLVINEIHADPHPAEGDANGDGSINSSDDDFAEIVNASGFAVDLSGWSLSDGLNARHVFPAGSVLPDRCAVVVFGGGAPEGAFGSSLVQTASTGTLSFDMLADHLFLKDPDGQVRALYSYGSEASHDQSVTRWPDITGPEPLVQHSAIPEAAGALFSPGTRADGVYFSGCP